MAGSMKRYEQQTLKAAMPSIAYEGGTWVFWPREALLGWNAAALRMIAAELDRRNAESEDAPLAALMRP